MLPSRFGQRSPKSSRNLPPDPVAELAYAVPKDDAFLARWRPTRKINEAIKAARREHTDFFHAPGCYGQVTNFENPPDDMSQVNTRILEVLKQTYNKGVIIARDRFGTTKSKIQDYTFFRFTLTPVEAKSDSQNQDWILQPLEKYKSRPVASTKVRFELMTTPKTSADKSVVFVRTHDSRVTPDAFLDNHSFAQIFRTKDVARVLTGVQPVSLVHAELLIDAAVEKKIITTRMRAQKPLPDFWKLPGEIRGRIYQLAAEAEGDIWPVDLVSYHQRHRGVLMNELSAVMRRCDHLTHGDNVVFSNGLILPQTLTSIVQSDRYYRGYEEHPLETDPEDSGDESEEDSSRRDLFKAFATPALLRTSQDMRQEVIKTLFVQPTFCFSNIEQLHKFITATLDDALSSLRKLRLKMSPEDLLTIFSLARMALTFDEKQLLESVVAPGQPRGHPQFLARLHASRQRQSAHIEKVFSENDAVFIERSALMRFTHLTIEVGPANGRQTALADFPGVPGLPGSSSDASANGQWKQLQQRLQLGRLLLVKLVNLTLDFWAQTNNSRPQLHFVWPPDMGEEQREALQIMNSVYQTTEVASD